MRVGTGLDHNKRWENYAVSCEPGLSSSHLFPNCVAALLENSYINNIQGPGADDNKDEVD